MQKPVSKEKWCTCNHDVSSHYNDTGGCVLCDCWEFESKPEPAPKLTPIDSIDLEVTYGEIWLNDKTVVVADAIKALADKVNEIIRRLENE